MAKDFSFAASIRLLFTAIFHRSMSFLNDAGAKPVMMTEPLGGTCMPQWNLSQRRLQPWLTDLHLCGAAVSRGTEDMTEVLSGIATLPFAGLRCLVVEDHFLIALDIERVLETGGAETVVCVSRASQALVAIEAGPAFGLAVLDVKLDSSDSFVVAAALTERGIPFIFLTGGPIDAVDLAHFHDAAVLTKPFDTATLSETLSAVLAAARRTAKPGAGPGLAGPDQAP